MASDVRIGIALGGGAARGMVHVGVLRGLQRACLQPDVVAGTSMGALIGGLYAAHGDVVEAEEALRAFVGSPEFTRMRFRFLRERVRPPEGSLFYSLSSLLKKGILLGYSMARPSFIPAEELAGQLEAILPDIRIEQARIPLVVVATDLQEGVEVRLDRGSLRSAVFASCAIPGLMPPREWEGRQLIDGGCSAKVPVRAAREMGVDFVIAVDVSADLDDTQSYNTGLNIMTRANAITASRLVERDLAEADFVIRPPILPIHWADFSRLDDAIAIGETALAASLDSLRAELGRRRQSSRFRFWRRRPPAEEPSLR